MSDSGGASEGSAHTQQPGVTAGDLGEEVEKVKPEDIIVTTHGDVTPPAAAPDDSTPTVNADLVDDPEEMARLVEAASGQSVEVVEGGGPDELERMIEQVSGASAPTVDQDSDRPQTES